MTTRKVIVVGSIDKGPSTHGYRDPEGELLIDTSPDRTVIYLQGINCTPSEFQHWLFTIEESQDRWDLISLSEDSIVDIGGSQIDFSIGTEVEIHFEQYFNALIKNAHNQLEKLVNSKRAELGL